MFLKSYFKEIVLQLATNGQSDKDFLLTSTFVPKGVVCPCPGAIYMYKSIKIYTRTRCQVSVYRTTAPLVLKSYKMCSVLSPLSLFVAIDNNSLLFFTGNFHGYLSSWKRYFKCFTRTKNLRKVQEYISNACALNVFVIFKKPKVYLLKTRF